jgi:hypothetical protein
MKNDFECRSYYYRNTDEAYPSKGSHMTPVTFMGSFLSANSLGALRDSFICILWMCKYNGYVLHLSNFSSICTFIYLEKK